MSSSPPLYELISSYWISAALNAALELDIFPALASSPQPVDGLAESLGCNQESLTALLDALTGIGLLEQVDGEYTLAPDHRPFLDPASPDSLLGAFAFNRDLQKLWDGLAESVRTGKPVMPSSPHLGDDPARTRRFVEGMHSRASLMARGLMQVVTVEPEYSLLDLAGGPGTFSVRLLQREPSLSITVFDLPAIVQAAEEIHSGDPAASRITFCAGDYHQDPLPSDHDMVLYCGALHQELPAAREDLFRKIREALRPGGMLLLVDLLLDENRSTPVYSALFDLNMRLMRPTSHVHSVTDVIRDLDRAGFSGIRTGDVPETPYRFVEAICT